MVEMIPPSVEQNTIARTEEVQHALASFIFQKNPLGHQKDLSAYNLDVTALPKKSCSWR